MLESIDRDSGRKLKRESRANRTISFRQSQLSALLKLAETERHGNVSLIVQRAIDRELERCETSVDAVEPEAAVA